MFDDISVDCTEKPHVNCVRIKASKTDPFRVEANTFVGRIDNDICPVAAVLKFMSLRGTGPGPGLGPGPGPFFRFSDSKP